MTRRYPRIAIALGLAILIVGTWLLIPSASLVSGRMLSWQLFGPTFDAAHAMTTTVVTIEAMRPDCVPTDDSWFEPVVAYTPVSVTIRLRVTDAAAAMCPALDPHALGYWSSFYVTVHLSEPLGRRPLFDGSSFPAEARPYQ